MSLFFPQLYGIVIKNFLNPKRASKSHHWFKRYGPFTEGVDFAYWWSYIGKGLRLQACFCRFHSHTFIFLKNKTNKNVSHFLTSIQTHVIFSRPGIASHFPLFYLLWNYLSLKQTLCISLSGKAIYGKHKRFCQIITRPGVAGAVLQKPPFDWSSQSAILFLKIFKTPWNF